MTNALPEDTAGIVAGVLQPGSRSLFVGLAHYETEQTNLPAALRYDWTAGRVAVGPAIPTLGGGAVGRWRWRTCMGTATWTCLSVAA